jgi:hypothetical protein
VYYFCNQLLHHFRLDIATALDLSCAWGVKDTNIRAADGSYYPWTRKELAGSLRNAAKHGKALAKQRSAPTFKDSRREAEQVAAQFPQVRPTHTKPDRGHPTGYLVRDEHYADYGGVILHLARSLPEDGSNPCARTKAYYEELYEAGVVASPWNHQRYMVVRDFLSDLGLLEWRDNTYRPGWYKQGSGKCCRWGVNALKLRSLLSTDASPLSIHSHDSQFTVSYVPFSSPRPVRLLSFGEEVRLRDLEVENFMRKRKKAS